MTCCKLPTPIQSNLTVSLQTTLPTYSLDCCVANDSHPLTWLSYGKQTKKIKIKNSHPLCLAANKSCIHSLDLEVLRSIHPHTHSLDWYTGNAPAHLASRSKLLTPTYLPVVANKSSHPLSLAIPHTQCLWQFLTPTHSTGTQPMHPLTWLVANSSHQRLDCCSK